MDIYEKYYEAFPDSKLIFNPHFGISQKRNEELIQKALKRGKPLTKKERGFFSGISIKELGAKR